ncbi:MAG: hypothetical protein ACR2KK_04520 [Acidimicrobiales bacterium]
MAGGTTKPEERERLSSFGVPGVWIGSGTSSVDGWAYVEPQVFGDRVQFVRRFVAAVASLVEVPEAAYVSNNLSFLKERSVSSSASSKRGLDQPFAGDQGD